MKGLVFLWVALLVLVAFSTLGSADHPDERSATFVGSVNVEHRLNEECADTKPIFEPCPVRFPLGTAFVTCDGGDGHEYTAGLYDGIAGVRFCEVPRGALIEVEFVRLLGGFSTTGIVTCPASDGYVSWNVELGRISDEGPTELEVPSDCDEESGEGHQDTTNITVYLRTADTVDPAIHAPVEGEIAFRVLSTGGSA